MKFTLARLQTALLLICIGFSMSFAFAQNHPQRFLLKDEGLNQLSYTDINNPSKNWYVPVPAGRDIQLVGHDCVMIGTGNGYEERKIATGEKVTELTAYPGTLSAHRLRNGNTLLTGMNWQDKKGVVMVEVDKNGKKVREIEYGGFTYLRLARETSKGTLMVAAEDTVFEGTFDGKVLWKVKVTGIPKPHVWQALRLDNGQTLISSGYSANLQIFNADGTQKDTISGPAEVHPVFYGGFQILPNRNIVVTNWQGHGPKLGASGIQLLEYTPAGKLVWSWKQDPEKFSSIQGVIVLDGLDTKYLHSENGKGVLTPVKSIQ